jgi:hypothetical protein
MIQEREEDFSRLLRGALKPWNKSRRWERAAVKSFDSQDVISNIQKSGGKLLSAFMFL